MPWSLILVWAMFFGFVNTHQRQLRDFRGTQGFHLILLASFSLGCVIGLALLIFYFTRVAWYWPLLLFVVGSLVGGIVFGLLDAAIGTLTVSLIAFAGWPASAIWLFYIIRGLHH